MIGRDGYDLTTYAVTDTGACAYCAQPLAGRFDGPAGRWGSRRMPVRLASLGEARS